MAKREDEVVFDAQLNSPARHSVVAELLLLKECCTAPSSIEGPLRALLLDKLKSQGGLASLEWTENGIASMSLNTHKSAAAEVLVGGFKTLDSYRKAALKSLQEHAVASTRPPRGTIAWYKTQFESESKENSDLIDEITLLTDRLESVMDFARKLAIKANKTEEFLALQSDLLRKYPRRAK
jgi:hypothetical protein